ncbi:hypothetical protein Chor_005712, partial [Crotalus horridus]
SLQVNIVPNKVEVPVGESKFFLCQVTGDAKSKEISWFAPNGDKLTTNQQHISVVRSDDSSTLTIYNANIEDAGIYKCVVSKKLTFKHAPSPQEFKEGEDAVIICDIVSSLPPTIMWKHMGRDVVLKKDVRFVVLSNNYLQIRGIKKSDEGMYRCEGRILARGEVDFRDIRIVVNGEHLALDGTDGELIERGEDEEKYGFSYDGSELTIHRVEKNDEAEYVCIAENKAGEHDATVHLKVFAKPQITFVENKTAMELEDQIILTCEASGDPIPSITWRTSSRNISSEEKTLDGRIEVRSHARVSSLTLKDIQYTDAGEYTCIASNTIGQDSQVMYLEVQYAPKLQGPVAVYTWEGNPANITCEVFAYPSAVISWFRDGQLLPSSNYSNIRIYNTPAASYLETVTGTPEGYESAQEQLCSLPSIPVWCYTPSAPSIEKVEPYSSTAQIKFDEPEASGGVPILWYKAEWQAIGEEDWHTRIYDAKEANTEGIFTVIGLKPETMYAIRLTAINGKGTGEISPLSDFKTQPVRK